MLRVCTNDPTVPSPQETGTNSDIRYLILIWASYSYFINTIFRHSTYEPALNR